MDEALVIVLVGYRASGKSTVAKMLSKSLSIKLVDLDAVIEERSGLRISTIFSEQGEEAFRDLEAACLAEVLSQGGPCVLATGGGAVIRAESRALLGASSATVIYLKASVQVLAQRLGRSRKGVRPSLTGRPISEEVAEVMAHREPWYTEVANHVVSAEQSLDAMLTEIKYLL